MYGGIHNAQPSLSRSVERMGVIECHLPAMSDKRQEHKEAPLTIAICLAKNNLFGDGRCMKCKTVAYLRPFRRSNVIRQPVRLRIRGGPLFKVSSILRVSHENETLGV